MSNGIMFKLCSKYCQSGSKAWMGTLLAACTLVMLSLLPVMDYHYYADAARAWRHGLSGLYDAKTSDFYYLPWSLVLLVPLSLLTDMWGQAVLNLISLTGLIWAVPKLTSSISFRILALSLITPFTVSNLILGQWDALIVAGVALGWQAVDRHKCWLLGLALGVIATKPTNALLPAVFLIGAIRNWPLRDIFRVTAPLCLMFAASLLACGADWPIRYMANLRTYPPTGYDVSLWGSGVGSPWLILLSVAAVGSTIQLARRKGVTGELLSYALVTNLIISPYVVPYHYVSTAPALAVLARRNWRIAALVWGFSVILFLAFLQRAAGLHMVAYPVALLMALLAVQDTCEGE